MKGALETIVREALSSYPVPRPSPTAMADALAASLDYEASRRHDVQWKKRAILTCYWIFASFGIFAVLLSIPLPSWRPAALTTWAAWAIPIVGALWLYQASIVRALHEWGTRYITGTYVNLERTR